MRIVLAPDSFGGSLSASQAADAMGAGWLRRRGGDDVIAMPMADGGPGTVAALHAAFGPERARLIGHTVTGPLQHPVAATWLRAGSTGYLEVAQCCGLELMPTQPPSAADSLLATSAGVGELIRAVADAGCRRAVLGLGGSATTDGGAGLLAALGAGPLDAGGRPLSPGGGWLERCAGLAGPPRPPLPLAVAYDVDNPLLGPYGAARNFAQQKGAGPAEVEVLERGMREWADVVQRSMHAGTGTAAQETDLAQRTAAGAAGGIGFAMHALGASFRPGAAMLSDELGLADQIAHCDLVLTGEGSFDWQSLRGKVPAGVAGLAAEVGVPCLVLAGRVSTGRRESGAAGVTERYSLAQHCGLERALREPAAALSELAEHVAAQWGR